MEKGEGIVTAGKKRGWRSHPAEPQAEAEDVSPVCRSPGSGLVFRHGPPSGCLMALWQIFMTEESRNLGSPGLFAYAGIAALPVRGTQHWSACRQATSEHSHPVLTLCLEDVWSQPSYPRQDPDQIDAHNCAKVVDDTRPWPDISDIPAQNADLIMFTDGSCTQNKNGLLQAFYAVVTSHDILEACILSGMKLVQAAELKAITEPQLLDFKCIER